uniref:Uncharacterized protein n=1 Tax=Parascaris equorum TaxID=6256 RepID=A0A914SEM8_PAREQ
MERSSPNACLMFSLLILLIIPTFHSRSALSVAATRKEVVEKGERDKISVHCHHGGLYQDDFFDIIKKISPKVTTLDIEAPAEKPNRLLWDDNLNRFKHLKVLRLVNCGIPAISRSLKLHSLEELDLRGNNIDHITISIFSEVPSIKTLNLAHNLLSVLPTVPTMILGNLSQLSTLDLADNGILEIASHAFIDLSYNELENFDSTIFGDSQSSIETLHLNGNRITHFSAKLLPSLVQLDISNNLFSSFSMSVLQNFINALDKVNLSHTCNMEHLVKTSMESC